MKMKYKKKVKDKKNLFYFILFNKPLFLFLNK